MYRLECEYALFTLGEVEKIAEFDAKRQLRIAEIRKSKAGKLRSMGKGKYKYGETIIGESRLSKKKKGGGKKGGSGTRKAHQRVVGGKVVLVRQGIQKKIGKYGGKLASAVGGKSTQAGKAVIGATKLAGKNPLIATGLAGAGVAGAGYGAYRTLTRKKRR